MTDPTADATKLLPSDLDAAMQRLTGWVRGSLAADEHRIKADVTLICGAFLVQYTHPQPAPPVGEPGWDALARKYYTDSDDRMIEGLRYAYSLGLAARPKVEDAEVEAEIKSLRGIAEKMSPAHLVKQDYRWKVADLLERLAGENAKLVDLVKENLLSIQASEEHVRASEVRRGEYLQRAEVAESKLAERETELRSAANLLERLSIERDGLVNRALLILDAKNEWHDRAVIAEAKLAEREAELAKADAVIADKFKHLGPIDRNFLPLDAFKAIERHAARQQQKASAEPTAREEETR